MLKLTFKRTVVVMLKLSLKRKSDGDAQAHPQVHSDGDAHPQAHRHVSDGDAGHPQAHSDADLSLRGLGQRGQGTRS